MKCNLNTPYMDGAEETHIFCNCSITRLKLNTSCWGLSFHLMIHLVILQYISQSISNFFSSHRVSLNLWIFFNFVLFFMFLSCIPMVIMTEVNRLTMPGFSFQKPFRLPFHQQLTTWYLR